MALDSGTRLGQFEVTEPIGAGGMGEVYRARDTKLGRDVAIKVLPDAVAESPERLARFEREAQLLASLNHPNIATVHGLEDAGGIHYLVMELVPGETLQEMLERGPIPVEEAVALIRQIIDGLEAAHESGVLHRDLKPANIKVTPDGVVRILDFGLAKAFEPEGAEVDSSLSPTITRDGTRAGVIMGTAAYMSPEQARGKPVDKRSDIFSFGSVLFEMLSGKRAFDGEMVSDILAAVIKLEPDWSQLPSSRLDKLVRRCLDKDPRRRLRDIGDARPELDENTTLEPVAGGGASKALSFGVALGLAAGVAIALGLTRIPSSPTPADVTRFSVVLPPTRSADWGLQTVALSPDGSNLVFRGDVELLLRRMDGESIERIPGTTGRGPFFSPDGEWFGFYAGGELKKTSLSGGQSVTLCSPSSFWGADWSDSEGIVFADRASGIWRVSPEGGEPELIVDNGGMAVAYPELIGDGKLLFADLGPELSLAQSQIVAASIDTGEAKPLNLRGTQPRYLESGHLVYVNQGRLMAVGFDRETMEARGTPAALVEGIADPGGALVAQYTVSESGTLAYMDFAGGQNLVWINREGIASPALSESGAYSDLRISPDGGRVAFQRRTADIDIWVRDLGRETFTRMSYSPLTDEVPVWSPDGRFIAYTTSNGSGRVLQRRTVDGSGSEEALWDTPNHTHVTGWTPDGKTLVLNENRPGTQWDVLTLNVDGDPFSTYLLESSFDERNPRLDPTGRWLAYESDESGEFEIQVTSFPVPGAKHVVSSGGGVEPVWSVDGGELFYRSGGEFMAVKVNAAKENNGGEFSYENPVVLFPDTFDSGGLAHTAYDVHSDGRFLFVTRPERAPDDVYRGLERIHVVVNWMAEVAERVPTP